ncbi:MAG: hypothetical protein HY016_02635 [Nitrosomonadales bacterium]|nr:hypothetical protein [Nitrosomonadales bacterium]
MANRHTNAKVTRQKDGNSELTLSEHETDSPIVPVAQLERLHVFKPDAVDWVINQTQIEAEHRRKETSKINGYIFAEHLIGQIFSLIIGTAGIGAGSWVAVSGQPWAGGTIATAAITGLAVVFLTGRKKPQ